VALRLTFFSLTALAFATCCVGGGEERKERERERERAEKEIWGK
jgi:hypothetical protein